MLPFDVKQVKAALRERKMGRLEIKHRGLQLDPDRLKKRLNVPGDNRGCLIIVGGHENARAIITKRRAGDANSSPLSKGEGAKVGRPDNDRDRGGC